MALHKHMPLAAFFESEVICPLSPMLNLVKMWEIIGAKMVLYRIAPKVKARHCFSHVGKLLGKYMTKNPLAIGLLPSLIPHGQNARMQFIPRKAWDVRNQRNLYCYDWLR